MARRLAANVALRNPDTSVVEVFEAGAVPPGWAADLITNPAVWADGDAEGEAGAAGQGGAPTPVAPDADEPDAPDSEPVAPPRAGKGSGRAAWATYAAELGVTVDDDMSRDDIVEAIEGP